MTDRTDIVQESASERDSFNGRIAIVVATLSAFLAVSNIKGGDVADAARDDLFDLADTFSTVALAMFALAALTRIRWLFWVAGASAAAGAGYGVAAYAGWTSVSAVFG